MVTEEYEALVEPARQQFAATPALRAVIAPDVEPALFARWMLRYSAHGVHMTSDVERWIATAGRGCEQLGMEALGKALSGHARAEAGHDRMMVRDAHALAAWLSEHDDSRIDVEGLLAMPPLASTRAYIELHERVTTGPQPFCQLGIELEIERLSTTLGPAVVDNCRRVLGEDGYSFLAEHVELDVGHTAFNQRQLSAVLQERPETLADMARTAIEALECYAAFVVECLELAEAEAEAEPQDVGVVPGTAR